ncbi:hypothetical protein K461DRAFT_308084 [Myriangium duriaei CBS 260.36]|uniref:Uncharacterized protein n=1 Tax=Myriangium duriaei CBS 260.36 TaxID=1168546 RepID=A0A9P4IXK8_9PEZI|nr:hypothetical protein K461DRAFT_308084 [Myriangium duriaei CBS 260.36]
MRASLLFAALSIFFPSALSSEYLEDTKERLIAVTNPSTAHGVEPNTESSLTQSAEGPVDDSADVFAAARAVFIPQAPELGSLIGTVETTNIYFNMSKIARDSQITVKKVVDFLIRYGKSASKSPVVLRTVFKALVKIVNLIFEELEGAFEDFEFFVLGADDGKSAKARRQKFRRDRSTRSVSWDLADDAAHAQKNILYGRAIIHADLKSQMIRRGVRNVTFAHIDDETLPTSLLSYQHGGASHYHWRPSQRAPRKGRYKTFKKHYPFFDAGGAGFKISGVVNPQTKALTKKDAEAVAEVIVLDYLARRESASVVGYQDHFESSGKIGHKLCFIAEEKKFGLQNEMHECFGKAR